ncbi:MAG TPA: primosomal protein N' [Puia sp.]|jgi:primosomal protein N' (replication factor Y)|nr:primosomal protein N' [Puia sp.]
MYAEVIIPLALPRNYTWSVPEQWQLQVREGCRVEVELRNKKYAGIVKRLHEEKPAAFEPKAIGNLLDSEPIVHPGQLRLWEWIAGYYLCSEGEVMAAALPAHFKLSSETILVFNEEAGDDFAHLDNDEFVVAEALQLKKELKLADVQQLLDSTHVYPVIKRLIEKKICFVWEALKETYSAKRENFVVLNPAFGSEEKLADLLNNWGRAPKQLELLLAWLHLSKTEGDVTRAGLLKKAGASDAQLKGLVDKEILRIEKRPVDRIRSLPRDIHIGFDLTAAQQVAFDQVNAVFRERSVCLLHGVTSSGKTQVYIRVIEQMIRQGRQVLYLLPEIALTSQIIRRLQQHFGGYIGIYHSKFSQNERLEIWNKIRTGEIKVVLGARSALFLPFDDLGLIVVDEEHDASYKQQEPAPRYHARDAAIYYASLFGARVLLGSATPSVETYYNACSGKYGLVRLSERFGQVRMPEITIIDTKALRVTARVDRRRQGESVRIEGREGGEGGARDNGKPILSPALHTAVVQTLAANKQVILFQNRRGYSPYQVCEVCGWIPQCRNCDVSLNFHKLTNKLHCHYCGTVYPPVQTCAACGNHKFVQRNFGTERIEEYLEEVFPDARIARMDIDSVRGKTAHDTLIQQFEQRRIDILVGTQMVVKGLDFEHVGLVGVLDADSILSFADYRVNERAFQLMEQVSGRAGRKDGEGIVLIQVANTAHPVLGYVQAHDYALFYQHEIAMRREFHYPPFSRVIRVTFRHRDKDIVREAAQFFAGGLKKDFGSYLVGPAEPVVARVRNQYLMELLLKLPKDGHTIAFAKVAIQQQTAIVQNSRHWKSVVILPDVDAL